MDLYLISLTVIGLAALSSAWVVPLLGRIYISYSLFYLAVGLALYSLPLKLPWPDPLWQESFTIHLTELVVIVAIMGTGLKIDHPFSSKKWGIPFRLVTITMFLSIAITAVIAWRFLGFDPASAILLGAVLAPTDPVLASDVQVGPPMKGSNDDVRFALTAEAGMNDGMAFPFTWLAVALAAALRTGEPWLFEWLWKDLGYRVGAGLFLGFVCGKLVALLIFGRSGNGKTIMPVDGFVAVALTLFVYGLTEIAHGYGFIAVFVASVTLRNHEINHEYHIELHHFTDQIERILLVLLLILFGGSLVIGVMDHLNWKMALLGLLFLFIIRPLTGLIGLGGAPLAKRKKLAISFFGIRGIGSFFYLSFALQKETFQFAEALWSLVAFIVLISIITHGLSAAYVMKRLGLRYTTS